MNACAGSVASLLLGLAISTASGAEFHVASDGSESGVGTLSAPWDLATALNHPAQVRPGDTIWMAGGRYPGSFVSSLAGSTDAPIMVRAARGERVTIVLEQADDGWIGLRLEGSDVEFRDFEVTCENPIRKTSTAGSWPSDLQRGSVTVLGSNLRLINLVIHDLGSGIGFWKDAINSELYGCIIYHNGWVGPDRSHGHGIYTQNHTGTKRITDCLVFGQFGGGIHIYGTERTSLKGYQLEGVASFSNGRPTATRSVLIGGNAPVSDIWMTRCFTHGSRLQIGHGALADNGRVEVTGCYLSGGVSVYYPSQVALARNTVIDHGHLLEIHSGATPDLSGLMLQENRWHQAHGRERFVYHIREGGNRAGGLEMLQEAGLSADSSMHPGLPLENAVFLLPNRYHAGRAHVLVYNWNGAGTVDLDLSGVLESGDAFQIFSADQLDRLPAVEGVFDGKIVKLPLENRMTREPLGIHPEHVPADPVFSAWVLMPTS